MDSQAQAEENFAIALRRLRLAKGLSTGDLAAMIGRTPRSILYFESGAHAPTTRAWVRLREILGPELPVP